MSVRRERNCEFARPATVFAGLDCGFTIRRPDELRASVHALAAQLAAQA